MKAKAEQAVLSLGIGIAMIGTFVARHMDLGGSFQAEVRKVVVLVCPENLKAGMLFTRSSMGGGYGLIGDDHNSASVSRRGIEGKETSVAGAPGSARCLGHLQFHAIVKIIAVSLLLRSLTSG